MWVVLWGMMTRTFDSECAGGIGICGETSALCLTRNRP